MTSAEEKEKYEIIKICFNKKQKARTLEFNAMKIETLHSCCSELPCCAWNSMFSTKSL